MTFASRMQHKIYWGRLKKPLEWTLKTVLAPWSYLASVTYHDLFWYPVHMNWVKNILSSTWGRLFANWEKKQLPPDDLKTRGWADVGRKPLKLKRNVLLHILRAFPILGMAVTEAPEFTARRRARIMKQDKNHH